MGDEMKRILYSVLVALLCFIIPLSHAQDILIDLKPYVNTSFEDDGVANNGKGGWTDEGINDMYIYPPLEYGQITRNGYTFNILSPGDAKGNSFIMLKGEERGKDKPEQVQIKLNEQSTKFIYFRESI